MIPHAAIDANFIGCSLVTQIYALTSMKIPPLEGSALSITKVCGGSNVLAISDNFEITGSLRTFSMASYEHMKMLI